MAKVISIISGKGGTGKSTVAASLSLSLASLGFSVLTADLDFGLRSLDLLLGVEDRVVFDIGDVLEGRCELEKAFVTHGEISGLKLLCAPSDGYENFNDAALLALLRRAAKGYDYCILDLPAGLDFSVAVAREVSDLVAVVTVPDRIAMRDTRKTVDLLLAEGQKPCRLIINKVGRESMAAGGLQDLDEMLDTIGIQLFGVVPWDPYVNMLPPTLAKPEKGKRKVLTQKVFDAMAERITGQYIPILLKSV